MNILCYVKLCDIIVVLENNTQAAEHEEKSAPFFQIII